VSHWVIEAALVSLDYGSSSSMPITESAKTPRRRQKPNCPVSECWCLVNSESLMLLNSAYPASWVIASCTLGNALRCVSKKGAFLSAKSAFAPKMNVQTARRRPSEFPLSLREKGDFQA
jgi:hypothetical protein